MIGIGVEVGRWRAPRVPDVFGAEASGGVMGREMLHLGIRVLSIVSVASPNL